MGVNERVATYRQKMRAAGFRPVQIWVPDTNAPGFREEAARQSAILAAAPDDQTVLQEIEAIGDFGEW